MKVERASSKDSEILTEIAISAKSHWGYPQSWMEIWMPALAVSEEYITAERCSKLGFDKLIIESDPNAVGFYEKMGACIVGENRSEVDGNPRVLPILEIQI